MKNDTTTQAIEALAKVTHEAKTRENDVHDLLNVASAQLSAIGQLIGDTNGDTVQVNATGLATLIANVDDQLRQGIEILTT